MAGEQGQAAKKPFTIGEKDKAISAYYAEINSKKDAGVEHETGLRKAFANLLDFYSKQVRWTLIEEKTLANNIRPDGVLVEYDVFFRGYWEAKDTRDDLETEIRKKIAKGYPLTNTIFEDTTGFVLYQNGRRALEGDLRLPRDLADLLRLFYTHEEVELERFADAMAVFSERIPDIARELGQLIQRERKAYNGPFPQAFAKFYALCQSALDPRISEAAVEEMLIQHLLTERLIRVVFNTQDFARRNVIAREIEDVIDALTAHAFNRSAFLSGLDRYYAAVEDAARLTGRGVDDDTAWTARQSFLNMVYERFFQGYSVRIADTHGIVYTPQEIVDFMVASVDEVLKNEFNRPAGLGEPGVQILDPATGTGNFIVNILRRFKANKVLRHQIETKYTQDLFCNEIMLLPYYIACLNIEHEFYSQIGRYEPFPGACFADTLDMAESRQMTMFSEPNTERVAREKAAPIMVVIGNPPYNVGQENENDNNKNRKYDVIDARIRETYAKASKATNKNALGDAYVKFFRWATDRLQGRDGIVCYVSNNSFVDQIAFDGMRKHLLNDFTAVYHLDLHGNIRQNPKLSGTTHNVFGIQVGVGITIAVRRAESETRGLYYYRVPEFWKKKEKLAFLTEHKSANGIEWQELTPDSHNTWLTEGMQPEFASFLPIGADTPEAPGQKPAALFALYSNGLKTNRDTWVYDFDAAKLAARMGALIEDYNAEVSRWQRAGKPQDIDNFVHIDKVKWSESLKQHLARGTVATFEMSNIRRAAYRPFTRQWVYFDRLMNERTYQLHQVFPTTASEAENTAIWVKTGFDWPMFALATNVIPDLLPQGGSQTFPYYTYDEDGSNRRENITDWALGRFQAAYGADVTKRDIFHYVYGLLSHPGYRERYAANLRRELPRLPLLADAVAFRRCAEIGAQLMALHLNYETRAGYPLQWQEHPDQGRVTYRVQKMKLTPAKDAVILNETVTLAGIPAEVYEYRLGNRSALEWVIDQYQVSTDKRSGIESDPNRPDDEFYIANLVCKVVAVSVETVALTRALAAEVALPTEA